ncbi:MAG: VWA domain-containing protein [Vicinamibacterales bacterium]
MRALAFLAAALIAAQQQRPPDQPVFRVEANLVRVDAFITKDGVPVEDLTAADFELLEDGVTQKIETFERVKVGATGRSAAEADPNSQREGNERAGDPRRRVFVIFLDTYHVRRENSQRAGQALARVLDQLLAPDDLVGVAKPEMDVTDLMLGHKASVIQTGLATSSNWGVGDDYARLDAVESAYMTCYPRALAIELIARRRERMTLDSLRDLVRHLQALRDERKAIIVVSEGWILFRDNQGLMSMTGGTVPGVPQIFTGPGGKPTMSNPGSYAGATQQQCDTDRMTLAYQNNDQYFRDITGEANRTNAAFYPLDAGGLRSGVDVSSPFDSRTQMALMRQRMDTLVSLATATDGLAVFNTNDLARGMQKVVADLSHYYLLGYYSTNTKLDGKYRRIRLRVKRPGLDVRARDGYRAATVEEITAADPKAVTPPKAGLFSTSVAEPMNASSSGPIPSPELSAALGRLSQIRPTAPLRLHAIAVRTAGGLRLWIAGELESTASRTEWSAGADASVIVTAAGGAGGAGRGAVEPGSRSFLIATNAGDVTGDIHVQARLTPRGGGAPAIGEVVSLKSTAPDVFAATEPLLFRLSGATARPRPAADFRFNRTERVRLEAPLARAAHAASGRVVDRAGQPLEVPVAVTEREGAGVRWLVADVNLAPLYNGDYGIELAAERDGTRATMVTAIRVVR